MASVRRYQGPVLLQEWGPLNKDGEWKPEVVEEVGASDGTPFRIEVLCPACVVAASPGDWEVQVDGVKERVGQSPFFACGTEYLTG